MRIVKLEAALESEYTAFILSRPESLLYHSVAYKKFLERLLCCQSHYLVAVSDKNHIEGVLPLMIQDGPLGIICNSLPYYGSNGAILASSADAC